MAYDTGLNNQTNNSLLTKTYSTEHIPLHNRNKEARRAYANFDKEVAHQMFGYRVDFSKEKMRIPAQDPCESQSHKPLVRFVAEVVADLGSSYVSMKYATKQRILKKSYKDGNY